MSAAYCQLAPGHPVHGHYHHFLYGFPASDENVLFERLILEINQAGLSWLTILRKRAAFRAAFADFDVNRIAAFEPADTERLLADSGIIRNRLKIEATIENAGASRRCADHTDRSRTGSMRTIQDRRRNGRASLSEPFALPEVRSSASS